MTKAIHLLSLVEDEPMSAKIARLPNQDNWKNKGVPYPKDPVLLRAAVEMIMQKMLDNGSKDFNSVEELKVGSWSKDDLLYYFGNYYGLIENDPKWLALVNPKKQMATPGKVKTILRKKQ